MYKKALITLTGMAALAMAATPVFAEILGVGGTHVPQGLGTEDTYLVTDMSGGRAMTFTTTASGTQTWVSVSGQCAILTNNVGDYVDVDILIDGYQIGPTQSDTAFCSGNGSFGSAMNGTWGVGPGTHTLQVRARIAAAGPYIPQANITGLSIIVSR